MKYYLRNKGKWIGNRMTKEEAQREFERWNGVISGLEIVELDEKVLLMVKRRRVRLNLK
jgi:hypothetical protein